MSFKSKIEDAFEGAHPADMVIAGIAIVSLVLDTLMFVGLVGYFFVEWWRG